VTRAHRALHHPTERPQHEHVEAEVPPRAVQERRGQQLPRLEAHAPEPGHEVLAQRPQREVREQSIWRHQLQQVHGDIGEDQVADGGSHG